MFSIGESIIAFRDAVGYPATVQQIEEHNGRLSYLIHFIGWNQTYDQWYSVDEENVNLFASTSENEAKFRSQSNDPSISSTISGPAAAVTTTKTPTPKMRFEDKDDKQCDKEADDTVFTVGEIVTATYQNCEYTAEVTTIEENQGRLSYRVHFIGWNDLYDRWVPVEEDLNAPGTSASFSERVTLSKRQ